MSGPANIVGFLMVICNGPATVNNCYWLPEEVGNKVPSTLEQCAAKMDAVEADQKRQNKALHAIARRCFTIRQLMNMPETPHAHRQKPSG